MVRDGDEPGSGNELRCMLVSSALMPCSTCCCDPCQYGRMLRLGQLAIAQRRTLRSHKGSCADTFDCICCCPLVELLCSIGCCCTDEFFDLGEGGKGYKTPRWLQRVEDDPLFINLEHEHEFEANEIKRTQIAQV